MISARSAWTCWNWPMPIDSTSSVVRPSMYSVLAVVRADDLVRHVLQGVRGRVEAVAELRVAEREAALVRHVHVVEDHHRVGLVEPRAERVVEVRAAVVERLAGDEREAGGVDRDRERERVRLVLRRAAQHGRGEHQQLVGERADRGEHPRAAHHDAVVVLADDVRHQRSAGLLAGGYRAVRLGRDEGVRAEQVFLADLLVVRRRYCARKRCRPGRTSRRPTPAPSARCSGSRRCGRACRGTGRPRA